MRDNAVVVPMRTIRRVIVVLLALLVVLALVLLFRNQLARVTNLVAPPVSERIDRSLYQAIFLTGGQVFFGKLEEQNDEYFLLSDVFYLSVPDVPGGQGQLVKRGTELHGPKEPMIIPAQQVLFIENISENGTVATAIRRFKAGELPTATAPGLVPPTIQPATAPPASASARPSPTR